MGVVFSVVAALTYGTSMFLTQMGLMSKAVPPLRAVMVNLIAANVLLWVAFLVSLSFKPVVIHWNGIAYFILAGLTAPLVGRYLGFQSIQRLGASRGSSFQLSEMLFAAPLAFILFGQRLTLTTLLGIVIVMVGMLLFINEIRSRGVRPIPVEPEIAYDLQSPALGGRPLPSPIDAHEEPWRAVPVLAQAGNLAPTPTQIYSPALAQASAQGGAQSGSGLGNQTSARPWPGAPAQGPRPDGSLRRGTLSYAGIGVACGLAAGLFFAAGNLFRQAGVEAIPSAVLGSAIGTLAALLVAAAGVVRGRQVRACLGMRSRDAAFFAASGITSSLGMLSLFWALDAGSGVAVVTAIKNTAPMVTFGLVAVFLSRHERITVRLGLLVVLVVFGALLTTVGRLL